MPRVHLAKAGTILCAAYKKPEPPLYSGNTKIAPIRRASCGLAHVYESMRVNGFRYPSGGFDRSEMDARIGGRFVARSVTPKKK